MLLLNRMLLLMAVALLIAACHASACQTEVTIPRDIPMVDVQGCSSSSGSSSTSYSLGKAIGQATTTLIRERFAGEQAVGWYV
jgi:hypothetical protein